MIVCDGCGKEMRYIKEVHEYFDYDLGIPELCGYGKRVRRRDYEKWEKQQHRAFDLKTGRLKHGMRDHEDFLD